ncbi:MAG: PilZ domain-containing protein [Gammaproteobacteria bacterium]|nr:PilZ domain-containing protein [Gammaproteobacteria bacterium]MDH5802518.1 PilZ domain-containing protein [Gammaproteobacteria bacterium]
MENRWSSRKDLNIGVDVHCDGTVVSCSCRDIAMGGAYLESSAPSMLSHKSEVELVFHLKDGFNNIKYALPAQIVRVDQQGYALRFLSNDTAAFRSLQSLLSYQSC